MAEKIKLLRKKQEECMDIFIKELKKRKKEEEGKERKDDTEKNNKKDKIK